MRVARESESSILVNALTRCCLFLLIFLLPGLSLGAPKVHIGKAVWHAKSGRLTVKGSHSGALAGMPLEVLDSSGRVLVSDTADGRGKFRFKLAVQRPELLCSVRVKVGQSAAARKVTGTRNNDCQKMPLCQILTPAHGAAIKVNQDVQFQAKAKLKDKKSGPLKLEWDFGGGAMGEEVSQGSLLTTYKRPDSTTTTVKFVRDNSRYRVRFIAMDGKNRYCEDSMEVSVGTPPEAPPGVAQMASVATKTAPIAGGQLAKNAGDVVVLPFPGMTHVEATDARFTPRLEVPYSYGPYNALNAQVFRKARLPILMTDEDVKLSYSASSNPDDPVGSGSINTTSQNWPLNNGLLGAGIQKTDMWEVFKDRPDNEKAPGYQALNFLYLFNWWIYGTEGDNTIRPDEGVRIQNPENPWFTFPGSEPPPLPFADDHGRYMPGRDQPYSENKPQDFTTYFVNLGRHTARNIPVTDIDDAGRVNPYPLFRVEVGDKEGNAPLAAVDTVVSSSKDLHCRGCHAKGKIAANDQLDWPQYKAAYHSSKEYGDCPSFVRNCSKEFHPPEFSDAKDHAGAPSSNLFDQEYAAALNFTSTHEFYDAVYDHVNMQGALTVDGTVYDDAPMNCNNCHGSMAAFEYGATVNTNPGKQHGDSENFYPRLSFAVHKFHGQLQRDPGDPNKILREDRGRPLRWDPAKGANPNSLFPVADAQGNSLPMEQNCLRCHAGHREPLYRDRHVTAGTTCQDCHGDMLAVGAAHDKAKPGPEGFTQRVDWYDQPDCGSCHTGNGNIGKDKANGYFSAGVRKQAFDAHDLSAMPREPETRRFAVRERPPAEVFYQNWLDSDWSTRNSILSLTKPLYRESRDAHGNVACGACHGGAHELWPNRDPKANDNVTALQLQGFPGPIRECNVCHTKDAFAQLTHLYAGQYMQKAEGLPAESGILGGPHGLHPVNDPNWWKQALDDTTPISNGSYSGGWHDNLYRKPGANGEDQCAACHGADHKGTRLSKTPVDLKFALKGGKVAKWKAGEIVGCNGCHSIERSFKGGPKGYKAPVNHDPVITSMPLTTRAVMGADYSYQVTASDPDGDKLSYSLSLKPGYTMNIDPKSGLVTTQWPMELFTGYWHEPITFPYNVTVSDGRGGYATQTVNMILECPAGQTWVNDNGAGACQISAGGITITSTSVTTARPGETYTYQVVAIDEKGLPMTYSLAGQPAGMNIDANGMVTWPVPQDAPEEGHAYQVRVEDAQGGLGTQTVSIGVCKAPRSWDFTMSMCM